MSVSVSYAREHNPFPVPAARQSVAPAWMRARRRTPLTLPHRTEAVAQTPEGLAGSVLRVGSKDPKVLARPRRALLARGAPGAFHGRHSKRSPSSRRRLCATPSTRRRRLGLRSADFGFARRKRASRGLQSVLSRLVRFDGALSTVTDAPARSPMCQCPPWMTACVDSDPALSARKKAKGSRRSGCRGRERASSAHSSGPDGMAAASQTVVSRAADRCPRAAGRRRARGPPGRRARC